LTLGVTRREAARKRFERVGDVLVVRGEVMVEVLLILEGAPEGVADEEAVESPSLEGVSYNVGWSPKNVGGPN
jgi:hypothetical protein